MTQYCHISSHCQWPIVSIKQLIISESFRCFGIRPALWSNMLSPVQQKPMPMLPTDPLGPPAKDKSWRERLTGIMLMVVIGTSIVACVAWGAFLAWILVHVAIGLLL